MGAQRKHGLYAVGFGNDILTGITRQNITTGSEVRGEQSSGDIHRHFLGLYAQRIAPGFTTRAIASALDLCGVLGTDIADLTGGFSLYAQKHADGSTRTSGNAHRKYNFVRGIVVPRRLSVEHRGDATLTYETIVTWDGNNDPLLFTDDVPLPSAGDDIERFTLGSWQIGGVALTGIRSLEIDFGIDAVSEGADSDIWDTLCSIRAVNSSLTLRGIDIEWLKAANIPLIGKAATHANTAGYLRKRAQGSTFVANGTAQHIKFTACGLAYIDSPIDASENDGAQTTLMMPLRYDGTNDPLTINTASAIT